jgi:glycosyltransferase involved in cell wall biosynthesis
MGKEPVDVVYVVASKLGSIGMGSAAYNAIKQLENSGLTYKVFCRGYDRKLKLDKKNILSIGYLEYLSLPLRFFEKTLRIRINPFKYINYFFGRFVLNNLPKCRIYHVWPGIAIEAAKKAKKHGAFLILEAANSHPMNSAKIINKEYENMKVTDLKINLERIKEEVKIYEIFDFVMCPSDFVYESYQEYGFGKDQLIKRPYGVDINKFKPVKKTGKRKFKVLFIGSIQLRKGIQYLLKAWEELDLKNSELIVVGRVWPDAQEIVKKYYGRKDIRFVGFDSDLTKYYKESAIFVFPSIEEGSALVNYEAMASGLPILVTKNAGSVAKNKKEGFIIPIRDSEEIKQKIRFFYENPDIMKKMGVNARKKAEKYTWENYGNNLKDFYKKILKEKSS